LPRFIRQVLEAVRQTLRQQCKCARKRFEDLAATFDFKLAFEDIERLIFPVIDVFRCPVMRRHGSLSESVVTLGVFADCLIGKDDPWTFRRIPSPA
jgi:hypothetical protein